jgi:hypothetical protein
MKGNAMKLYRFSPIRNEKELVRAAKYVASQNTKLCKKVIGKSLPITSLTIFSHYEDEYKRLEAIVLKFGKPYRGYNGVLVILNKPLKAGRHAITHLRIRKPDPYRMQVGCSDFVVKDYQGFKARFSKHLQNLRLIQRDEYEMIEFFDPDFDVLAYVVSKEIYPKA